MKNRFKRTDPEEFDLREKIENKAFLNYVWKAARFQKPVEFYKGIQKQRTNFHFFVQGGATVAAWDAADSTPTERIATS